MAAIYTASYTTPWDTNRVSGSVYFDVFGVKPTGRPVLIECKLCPKRYQAGTGKRNSGVTERTGPDDFETKDPEMHRHTYDRMRKRTCGHVCRNRYQNPGPSLVGIVIL